MDTLLSKKIGLIAGDGELPVCLAKTAQKSGFEVITISLTPSNKKQLQNYCKKVYSCGPGELLKALKILKNEEISQLSFIGKVHKGMLFRNPRLDSRAIKMLRNLKKLNDDNIMLEIINELALENINVLDQTIFLQDVFVDQGVIGKHRPTEEQQIDIDYGFAMAKEMGRLDIGQSVVVQNKMMLAVEAIEGTDRAIERGCKLGNGAAVVVKVSKPNQDQRFDIPTVGLNTIQTMKKFGGKVLAIEAGKTIIVQKEEMIKFADRNGMVFIAV